MTPKIRMDKAVSVSIHVFHIGILLPYRNPDAYIFHFKGDYQSYGTHNVSDQSG